MAITSEHGQTTPVGLLDINGILNSKVEAPDHLQGRSSHDMPCHVEGLKSRVNPAAV